MKERITMFITYIEFFHKLHTKYLKRFSNKIQLIYTDINNDIKFDESLEINSPNSRSNSDNKRISQYNTGYSDNESIKSTKSNKSIKSTKSNKSIKSDKIVSRKQSLNSLSDSSSISSKSDLYETDGIDLDKSVSDEEMNELFLNIESSCESIINKNIVSEVIEVVNEILIEETIDSTKINPEPDNIELKIEEKEEIQKEEKEEKEEINTELNDNSSITETNESEQEPEPEPEAKKKRTYKPRKKKT
jgi:hypothetical protein